MTTHRRIINMLIPHWPTLAMASVCMAVVGGLTAALAWLIQPVMDDLFMTAADNPTRAQRMLIMLPVALFLVQLLRGASAYGEEVLMNRVGQRIITTLREMIYANLQRLSLAYFDRTPTGDIISRATNEVGLVQDAVSRAAIGAVRDVFTIIGLTGVVFYRDWKLALGAVVILPLAMYPLVRFGRMLRALSHDKQNATAELSTLVQETVTGVRVVKAFTAEEHEKKRFFNISQRLKEITVKSIRVDALTSPVMESLAGLGLAGIMGYGGWQVIQGTATPGTFFSFMAALILLYEPVKKITRANNHIQQGLAAAARIFQTIDTLPQVADSPQARPMPPFETGIEFRDVVFAYEARQGWSGQGAEVLKGVSLTAPKGSVLALVGGSGGGKTTLVNLVPRFHDVKSGAVLIDGVDVRDLSLSSLRANIGLVTQEIILFNESIRDNIAFGRPRASDEEIIRAAKAANAHDFITALPEGYDTQIGEQGVRLSGGQRQRLAIARALLKDAPILILDEATSSLDTESERAVQAAINTLMEGRTVLVIAHRLSTIRRADNIVVLVEGELKEQGRHEELMALEGEYYKLYQMQFSQQKS